MCESGSFRYVKVINQQNSNCVKVDSCIADEIQFLNDNGIVTLGCCCGHGHAGQIVEWENDFGKWKGYVDPPHALIDQSSVNSVIKLGYRPFPYYYADGEQKGVWRIFLKSGCITIQDCINWAKKEGPKPFKVILNTLEDHPLS